MTTIDKTYTIKFIRGGIRQYAYFKEVDGKIINPSLDVMWVSEKEIPDISSLTSIEDILNVIKKFSYAKQAEIYLINGEIPFYENNKRLRKVISETSTKYNNFITSTLTDFFKSELVPILKKNKWFVGNSAWGRYVLIKKDKHGEWDNISKIEKNDKKEFEFEYLCYKILRSLDLVEYIDLKTEHSLYISVSHTLFSKIDDFSNYFIKL